MKTLLLSLISAFISFQFIMAQNHPPVAVADTVFGFSQTPMLIDVLTNDYDPDNDSIYITDTWSYSGTATIQDGKVHYVPGSSIGEQSFRYTVSDGLSSDNEWVRVMVAINPNAPVAVADTFDLLELSTQQLDILSNDFDPDGDDLKIISVTSETYCTVTINPDSLSVTVSVYPGEYAYFYYNLSERAGEKLLSDRAKVEMFLSPNPDRPVAVGDTAYTTGGISIVIPVILNDHDPQGESLEVYYFGAVDYGLLEKIDGGLRYTPHLSFSGEETTYYTAREVNDTSMYSEPIWIQIYVGKNPHCPIGLPDTASGMSAVPVIIDVLANDHDPDGDLIEIAGGVVTSDNKILYTSMSFVTGYDSITYRVREVNNPLSYSDPVKVKIKLQPNPAFPWGVNDTVSVLAGGTVVLHPLENDIHNGFDSLNIRMVFRPDNDDLGLIEYDNRSITFTAPYQAEGTCRLSYIMNPPDSNLTCAGRADVFINILKRYYYDSLTVNNINAGVDADGNLFSMIYRYPEGSPMVGQYYGEYYQHFKVPANQSASTIFQNRFIIGGYDQNNELHISGNMEDWKAGPLSDVYNEIYDLTYLRLWKLTREEVEFHKQNRFTAGYEPSAAIMAWPGTGDAQAGQALHLAPYFDENVDGYYDPDNGDYPLIRGDECIFFMTNDNTARIDTTGQPLNVELHGMVYGFNNSADTALFNTVFVHYDIINRSANTYNDCYAAVFNDYDIGAANDDYYRTDVTRASVIGYNGKDIDTSTGYEQNTYGDNPPAQSVTILAGPFMDADNNDNPTGGCDESINGINFGNGVADDERHGLSCGLYYHTMEYSWNGGVDYQELYNFMTGIWDDETQVMYGGNGHITNGGNGTPARYMFPGDSDPLNYGTNCQLPGNGYNQGTKFWTEEQVRNHAGDRRALASMGPFTLAPGQVQEIELAYCAGLGNNGAMSSVNQLLRNIDSLKHAVAQGNVVIPNSSLGIGIKESPSALCLYPNPASDIIAVSNTTIGVKEEYVIFNLYGVRVMRGYLTDGRSTVSIGCLTPGIYIMRITDGKYVSTGKFVKK